MGGTEEEINPHSVSQRLTLGKNIQTVGLLNPFLDSFMHLSPYQFAIRIFRYFWCCFTVVFPLPGEQPRKEQTTSQMQSLPQLPSPTCGCDGDKDKVLCSHTNPALSLIFPACIPHIPCCFWVLLFSQMTAKAFCLPSSGLGPFHLGIPSVFPSVLRAPCHTWPCPTTAWPDASIPRFPRLLNAQMSRVKWPRMAGTSL